VAPASTNLTGRWDVTVEFFSSKSQHTLFIEQDGNHIRGSHKGDFSVRELYGMIEGDQVRLRSSSAERGSGDSVQFTFSGSVSGDGFAGPIYMGEYLNAKYTAKRHAYPNTTGTILVPGGPPLAN
jgi:D-glucosaminate-6-phosphate ammonia-lyase